MHSYGDFDDHHDVKVMIECGKIICYGTHVMRLNLCYSDGGIGIGQGGFRALSLRVLGLLR